MAKDTTSTNGADAPASADNQAQGTAGTTANQDAENSKLSIITQYVKDLSFENPQAPRALIQRNQSPTVNVGVNVNANPLSETDYDVLLTLNATAKHEDNVIYNVELVYGGVFRLTGFPKEHMLPLLFIECPRLIFPFARQIVSEATRNGGFPPLLLEPINFTQLFQQRMAAERAKNAEKTAAPESGPVN